MSGWAQRNAEAAEDAMQAHADEVVENDRLRKRIAELEADAKRWKDAFTTSQTHLDVVAEKLIPLLPGGWKHDWAGDVADGISERITGLEAERDKMRAEHDADIEALQSSCDALLNEAAGMREALKPFAHFIDQWDRKPLRGIDDHVYGIHPGTELEATISRTSCRAAKAALTAPATSAALERVRREAQADLLKELIDECATVFAGDLPHITRSTLVDRAAELRGGK